MFIALQINDVSTVWPSIIYDLLSSVLNLRVHCKPTGLRAVFDDFSVPNLTLTALYMMMSI